MLEEFSAQNDRKHQFIQRNPTVFAHLLSVPILLMSSILNCDYACHGLFEIFNYLEVDKRAEISRMQLTV